MRNPFDIDNRARSAPDNVVVGNFTAWNRLLDFDPVVYGVKYSLRAATVNYSVPGVFIADQSLWSFEITAAMSTAWVPGTYTLDLIIVRLSDSAESILETGSVQLFAATEDRRQHAVIMLAKITSILENRADSDVTSYSIASRSITKMTVEELTKWRDYYRDELRQDPSKQGKPRNTVLVRFT